jgi:hypothetical protein
VIAENIIDIYVRSQDGSAECTYTLKITRKEATPPA